jgi:LPXTG-motif cell wall-anchored protein
VHTDSNYTDYPGPRIKIHNPLGSALPYYPEVEPSFLYPSPKYGVVRVRNCAGEDFNFDYRSPDGGKSADDTFLKGKSGESICTFEDLTLIPGRYQGSGQGGAQDHSFGFDLQIEAGRVYEILYIGPNNTGPEFSAGEVAADDPMGTPMMKSERMPQSGPGQMGEMGGPGQMGGEMGGPGQMGGPNPNNEQMGPNPNQQMGQNPNQQMGPNPNQQMGPDKGMDQKADGPKAKPESMLPETGESQDWNMPGIAMGSILILILGIGGVVALRRRPTLKEANGRAGSNHSAEPPE